MSDNKDYKILLEEAIQQRDEWRELAVRAGNNLQALKEIPYVCADLIKVNDESAYVSVNGKIMEVKYLPDLKNYLTPGRTVRLDPKKNFLMDLGEPTGIGSLTQVTEILPDGRPVVDYSGFKRIINSGLELNQGDRIIVDPGFNVVLQNLGKTNNLYNLKEVPNVPWSRIGGLEKAITEIRDSIEKPFLHMEKFREYGKEIPNGIILYGPPGCGKTLIGKAIAHNITQKMGVPLTVGFLDEAEAMLARRSEGSNAELRNSVVQTFLAEMDGIQPDPKRKFDAENAKGYFLSVKGPEFFNQYFGNSEASVRDFFKMMRESSKYAILLAATNRAETLDPAVTRDGRFDTKIYIGRPNKNAVEQIFNIHLEGMPIFNKKGTDNSRESLAKLATEEFFRSSYPLYNVSFFDGTSGAINLSDLSNGAMIEGIAQRAAGKAINRDIETGEKGLKAEDLVSSIRDKYLEVQDLSVIYPKDYEVIFPEKHDQILDTRKAGKVVKKENSQELAKEISIKSKSN
ncbi:MAG: AAA family ATPase [Nanoarchaeota archaeon]|nr:AAA family ATPase [Nanoarchaeota archaeon]